MKKIMFNDNYGLTKAVLEGRKTMTRRIITDVKVIQSLLKIEEDGTLNDAVPDVNLIICAKAKYDVGEVVAIAQGYKDALNPLDWVNKLIYQDEKSWSNKMFVKSDLMPHKIRITKVRIKRLQDISDEDCLKEGIIEDFKGVQYAFPTNVGYCGQYPFDTAKEAFAELIDKLGRKGTWKSNPFVFVYEFVLIK